MRAIPFTASGAIQQGAHVVNWRISSARYAKGQCSLIADSLNGCWKSIPHRLAEDENARHSNREHAYILSPSKARRIANKLREMEAVSENQGG